MPFVVGAVGEADLVFTRQVQAGNDVHDEIGHAFDVGCKVEVFLRIDAVERAGRKVTRVVAAGTVAVYVVIKIEEFFFF